MNGRSGLHCGLHGGATSGGCLCGLCEWLVRPICPWGPWVVGNRQCWCPVALLGAGRTRERGVQIVQMLCRSRASRMRKAALWCQHRCSRSILFEV